MSKQKYTKRKDGRYATTFKGQCIYGNSSKELEEKIIELKCFSKTGFSKSKITFEQYASIWFNLQKKLYPDKVHSKTASLFKKYIYPEIGSIQIQALKKSNVENIQANMIEKGLTDRTNRALRLIKNILNSAIDDNILVKNVAFNLKGHKFSSINRKPLSQYEDELLLEVAQTHKFGLFFLFMRYCGLRPEEARAIKVGDIDIKKQSLKVHDAVSFSKQNQGYVKDTKNFVHREIPILDFMITSVSTSIANSQKLNTDFLFYKLTNVQQHMSQSSYKSCVNSFLFAINKLNKDKNKDKKSIAEIKFVPYQLRHSYCTMLYYSGIGIKEAQDLMGDKDSKMVLDVYTHLQKDKEDSLKKLNNYFETVVKK